MTAAPFTFDELSQLYREEMRYHRLTEVPTDLYQRFAATRAFFIAEYTRQREAQPDSAMLEGARVMVIKVRRLTDDILRQRTQKIVMMAVKATFMESELPVMPLEEKVLYLQVRGNVTDIRRSMEGSE